MSQIGPAIVFPLGDVRGVLTVGRLHGAVPFPPTQADVVASFAAQAGVALELAARRAEAQRLSLYEDRDRVGPEPARDALAPRSPACLAGSPCQPGPSWCVSPRGNGGA